MAKFDVHVKGLDERLARIRSREQGVKSVLVEMTHTATSAGPPPPGGRIPPSDKSRTASQNWRIDMVQRTKGRHPWFTTAAERRSIMTTVTQMLTSGASLDALAHAVGERLKAVYTDHIAKGISKGGEMTPLLPGYTVAKAGQLGANLPRIIERDAKGRFADIMGPEERLRRKLPAAQSYLAGRFPILHRTGQLLRSVSWRIRIL